MKPRTAAAPDDTSLEPIGPAAWLRVLACSIFSVFRVFSGSENIFDKHGFPPSVRYGSFYAFIFIEAAIIAKHYLGSHLSHERSGFPVLS
jgi:hypothetical protein